MKWSSSVGLAACQGLNGHMWVVAILSVQPRHLDRRFYWTELSGSLLRLPPTEFPFPDHKWATVGPGSQSSSSRQGGAESPRADQVKRQRMVAPSFSQRYQKCYPFQRCVMLRKTEKTSSLSSEGKSLKSDQR